MNKEQIKKTLAGIGIAGLITTVTMLNGCQKAETGDEGAAANADTTAAAKASCGAGMDSTKASCGTGSCGQQADTTKASCGQ